MVPKPEYVKEYRDWLQVTDIVKSNDQKAKDEMVGQRFVVMKSLLQDKTDTLIAVINSLWEDVVPMLPSVEVKIENAASKRIQRVVIGSSPPVSGAIFTTTSGTANLSASMIIDSPRYEDETY